MGSWAKVLGRNGGSAKCKPGSAAGLSGFGLGKNERGHREMKPSAGLVAPRLETTIRALRSDTGSCTPRSSLLFILRGMAFLVFTGAAKNSLNLPQPLGGFIGVLNDFREPKQDQRANQLAREDQPTH